MLIFLNLYFNEVKEQIQFRKKVISFLCHWTGLSEYQNMHMQSKWGEGREKRAEVNICTHSFCDINLFLFQQVSFQNLSSPSKMFCHQTLILIFHCMIKTNFHRELILHSALKEFVPEFAIWYHLNSEFH